VPDDLLRYVSGPTPYSWWWLVLAAILLLGMIGWYAGVFVFTAPGRQIRNMPLIGASRTEWLKRRYAHAVKAVGDQYRAGELSAAPAATAISRELRAFLHRTTGADAEYMHLDAIATSELAPAAPVLAQLLDAQFNADSTRDVGVVSDSAEELIRTWS
jgi:hypothetical protein